MRCDAFADTLVALASITVVRQRAIALYFRPDLRRRFWVAVRRTAPRMSASEVARLFAALASQLFGERTPVSVRNALESALQYAAVSMPPDRARNVIHDAHRLSVPVSCATRRALCGVHDAFDVAGELLPPKPAQLRKWQAAGAFGHAQEQSPGSDVR